RIALGADVQAGGIALTDPALAKAVGDRFRLTFEGRATPGGATEVETARLVSPSLEASYTGRLGTPDATGALEIQAPDLSRFGDVASLQLRGRLELNGQIQGLLSSAPLVATLDGNASRFATGLETVDGLAGGRLTLSGIVRLLPNGGLGFQNLRLEG